MNKSKLEKEMKQAFADMATFTNGDLDRVEVSFLYKGYPRWETDSEHMTTGFEYQVSTASTWGYGDSFESAINHFNEKRTTVLDKKIAELEKLLNERNEIAA